MSRYKYKTVYRLEYLSLGPYYWSTNDDKHKYFSPWGIKYLCSMGKDHVRSWSNGKPAHPTIGNWINIKKHPHYFSGFSSEDKLKLWFGRYLPRLLKMGFNIVIIIVKKKYVIRCGREQLAFNSKKRQ